MATLTLQVNGAARSVEIDDPATPLLYVLRNDLALMGTRFGCGLAQCVAIEAGIAQPLGRSSGQVQQNIDPPYRVGGLHAVVHWLRDTPFRTSPIRAPGKVGNTFAVESFVDEVCALARVDPVEFRLQRLTNPRGLEVVRRAAARMGWQRRPSPRPAEPAVAVLTGRGIAYIHYKHSENHVAMGMEVTVERATGVIRVTRVVCAHDCGLMINPDNVESQLEGNILQTISRTLDKSGAGGAEDVALIGDEAAVRADLAAFAAAGTTDFSAAVFTPPGEDAERTIRLLAAFAGEAR